MNASNPQYIDVFFADMSSERIQLRDYTSLLINNIKTALMLRPDVTKVEFESGENFIRISESRDKTSHFFYRNGIDLGSFIETSWRGYTKTIEKDVSLEKARSLSWSRARE